MNRVVITTLGCKVNQYESAAFQTGFIEAGFTIAKNGEPADLVVINTCAVTARAGAQSRQAVRQALRANPEARIIITGCYVEIGEKELSTMDELAGRSHAIIGNSKKDHLVANAAAKEDALQQRLLGTIAAAREICNLPVDQFGERTRAYLRVQDGCNSYCTYCIVPFTRGPSRSLAQAEALTQAERFAAGGYREIVITGIHLGFYGRDLSPACDLTDLLDRLTAATPKIRYRISSLEPTEISERLLGLMARRDNIMPHLHIPLQSGDDEILARMNRHYSTADFAGVIDRCRAHLADCALGIDILVGFPGESEAHFRRSREFIEAIDCTYLHVFPYSRRPGTAAANFVDQVPKAVKDERVAILRAISDRKRDAFYLSQLGRTLPVLVEGRRDRQGLLQGYTDNYVPVHFQGPDSLHHRLVDVLLTKHDGPYVSGEVREPNER
ncbi:MAG: tRNA (N(6)-L-threonylcarbamoyladenosine(37)-C(2))-methylthiotransferase MtaB [Desulfopila sp.]